MKLVTLLAVCMFFESVGFADITHENQFSLKDTKVWEASGNRYDGDYEALEGDHTGTSSVHIRSYAEGMELFLWFTIISQDDLAVLPAIKTFPKYVRTRTNGTFKDQTKIEYIKFVRFKEVKGVVIRDRFYKFKQVRSGNAK